MDVVTKRVGRFNTMDKAALKEVSSLGGKAVPAASRSFAKNRELAAAAGRKGALTRKLRFAQQGKVS